MPDNKGIRKDEGQRPVGDKYMAIVHFAEKKQCKCEEANLHRADIEIPQASNTQKEINIHTI